MLKQLLIFTTGGLILWTCKELGNALKGSPIDTLISSCLLEERLGAASYNYNAPGAAYTLKWTFHNDLALVFVAVYQRILHLLHVDDLLAMVKLEFSEIYDPKWALYNDLDDVYQQLRNLSLPAPNNKDCLMVLLPDIVVQALNFNLEAMDVQLLIMVMFCDVWLTYQMVKLL
ncbi:hypothetical protein Vadar_027203 [Vaccinium darrowii]|uniref:Uncharacterized protein n=1 Tax=Vaccinium darrowii TaxID=229202 RepID=A0ACB7Y222_9ERIC|nr:hypothetical protein Vadar_027203 [Vaccinium darrowii]